MFNIGFVKSDYGPIGCVSLHMHALFEKALITFMDKDEKTPLALDAKYICLAGLLVPDKPLFVRCQSRGIPEGDSDEKCPYDFSSGGRGGKWTVRQNRNFPNKISS